MSDYEPRITNHPETLEAVGFRPKDPQMIIALLEAINWSTDSDVNGSDYGRQALVVGVKDPNDNREYLLSTDRRYLGTRQFYYPRDVKTVFFRDSPHGSFIPAPILALQSVRKDTPGYALYTQLDPGDTVSSERPLLAKTWSLALSPGGEVPEVSVENVGPTEEAQLREQIIRLLEVAPKES